MNDLAARAIYMYCFSFSKHCLSGTLVGHKTDHLSKHTISQVFNKKGYKNLNPFKNLFVLHFLKIELKGDLKSNDKN